MSSEVRADTAPEDPLKLAEFRKMIVAIATERGQESQLLPRLFDAVDALADAEVRYYFGQRRKHARWSLVFRISGWGLGTIGVLLPLASVAFSPTPTSLASWGYAEFNKAAADAAARQRK